MRGFKPPATFFSLRRVQSWASDAATPRTSLPSLTALLMYVCALLRPCREGCSLCVLHSCCCDMLVRPHRSRVTRVFSRPPLPSGFAWSPFFFFVAGDSPGKRARPNRMQSACGPLCSGRRMYTIAVPQRPLRQCGGCARLKKARDAAWTLQNVLRRARGKLKEKETKRTRQTGKLIRVRVSE